MPKQITTTYGVLSPAALEDRLHLLETKVDALTEAVRTLASALSGTPLDEPDEARSARAAERAHEILLAAGMRPSPRG